MRRVPTSGAASAVTVQSQVCPTFGRRPRSGSLLTRHFCPPRNDWAADPAGCATAGEFARLGRADPNEDTQNRSTKED
jgi:hypothetical protein